MEMYGTEIYAGDMPTIPRSFIMNTDLSLDNLNGRREGSNVFSETSGGFFMKYNLSHGELFPFNTDGFHGHYGFRLSHDGTLSVHIYRENEVGQTVPSFVGRRSILFGDEAVTFHEDVSIDWLKEGDGFDAILVLLKKRVLLAPPLFSLELLFGELNLSAWSLRELLDKDGSITDYGLDTATQDWANFVSAYSQIKEKTGEPTPYLSAILSQLEA